MPHKHTRKKGADDSNFNIDPSTIARPLSALPKTKTGKEKGREKSKRPRRQHIEGYGVDDTPRAFARLMQAQNVKRPHSALDDGDRLSAKKKKKAKLSAPTEVEERIELPKIMPGERLADFSARVNHAIPISGLVKRGNVKMDGVKERRTLKEKKMHKMYAEWREQDAKIKAKQEEQAEQAEEAEEDRMAEFNGQEVALPVGKRRKRLRAIGEVGKMDDDPWAVLRKTRQAPRGLHDVAQAPPDLKVIPKEKFKVKNGARISVANVPTSAGSLKKREELSEARREVIERYRSMMKANS